MENSQRERVLFLNTNYFPIQEWISYFPFINVT